MLGLLGETILQNLQFDAVTVLSLDKAAFLNLILARKLVS